MLSDLTVIHDPFPSCVWFMSTDAEAIAKLLKEAQLLN
jgi:hypothetical protein